MKKLIERPSNRKSNGGVTLLGLLAVLLACGWYKSDELMNICRTHLPLQFKSFCQPSIRAMSTQASPFYSFKVNDLKGQPYDLNQLKGKVVLIVNTASKCGFTSQYDGLQTLYKELQPKGLEILGFPCNQFGAQEPGTEEDIQSFCKLNFGVSFPMMAKIDVNGDSAHPLYEWLKNEKTQLMMSRIKWNFEKFLVDRNGKVVDRYASTATPESMKADIEKLL
eukprot:Partr_v1_DN28822_c1_g1_i2_m33016 putative glutathione peroxidase